MNKINNLEALETAMLQQQQSLKMQEAELLRCWQQLPTQVVKVAATSVVAFTLNRLVVGNVWGVVKQVWNLLGKQTTDGTATNTASPLVLWAKKIGAVAALRLAVKFLKKN